MTYLQRDTKSGIYRFRRAVPRDVRDVIGKSVWKVSLDTTDLHLAKRLALPIAIQVEDELLRARRSESEPVRNEITREEAERYADAWLAAFLEEDEESRRDGGGDAEVYFAVKRQLGSSGAVTHFRDHEVRADYGMSDREVLKKKETVDTVGNAAREALARGDIGFVVEDVDEFIAAHSLGIAEGSPAYRELGFTFLKAYSKGMELVARRQGGEVVDTPSVAPVVPPASRTTSGGETLSAVLEAWLVERKPVEKTEHEWRRAVRRWEELHGPKPLPELVVSDVSAFKDVLLRCPSRPPHAIRALPLPELAEVGDQRPDLPKTKAAAVNKTVGAIRSLLGYAVRNGKVERNVALGVSAYVAPKMEDEEQRPFTDAELQQVVDAAWLKERESDRWLPLLSAFMGARQSEIGLAKTAHVVTEDEVTYLWLRDERAGRRLKNKSSRRKVPLHPELVRLGFLSYVEALPKSGSLFPGLNVAAYSKRFGTLCDKVGLSDPLITFHSLRHSYKDACRLAGIAEEVHDGLTGHSGGGRSGRGYGAGVPLAVLAGAVEKIVYPGLDLTGLSRRT